ncbi:MAG TPA: 4-(cytidine 5'-diphospho)-2-C-methyl-D-erythritol kinase, partial [Chryseolinea sp.]|nr:4-(cytidine 5'-diphospho)-2-C-methyl-D-erythritol kinase [Chryseolinea sp.]
SDENNLCVRAYRLLQHDFALPHVSILLHKIVPMGAGLGGGSSDGAHTLRLLNSIFNLGLSSENLMNFASQLGSDCAFFVQDEPMLGTGRGEILTPVTTSLKGKWLILVKPNVHVSTAAAFAGIRPQEPRLILKDIIVRPIVSWKELMKNDFEQTVFMAHPLLEGIKQMMYQRGAVFASMSGSGSTIFGIFEKETTWIADAADTIVWQGWIP